MTGKLIIKQGNKLIEEVIMQIIKQARQDNFVETPKTLLISDIPSVSKAKDIPQSTHENLEHSLMGYLLKSAGLNHSKGNKKVGDLVYYRSIINSLDKVEQNNLIKTIKETFTEENGKPIHTIIVVGSLNLSDQLDKLTKEWGIKLIKITTSSVYEDKVLNLCKKQTNFISNLQAISSINKNRRIKELKVI